jgi:TRAP transporter TAXI family solute receptor
MHFVMSADTGATAFADLAGKTILLGKGSFGATEGEKYLDLFGVADDVEIADVELSNAVPALQNGRIDGFVTAGSYPAPNVVEAAASTDVTLIPLTDAQVEKTGRTRLVIPAGTYPGQEEEVVTTSLPVAAYTTTQMDDETAYELTRTFWESRDRMAENAPWWAGVTPELLANIDGEFHPGAVRYYEEAGIPLGGGQM